MRVSPRPQLAAQWRRTAAAPPIVRSSVANALIRYPKYKISRRYTPCTASSSFSAPYCADVKPVRPNKRGNDIVAHFEPDTMTNLTDVILRRVGKVEFYLFSAFVCLCSNGCLQWFFGFFSSVAFLHLCGWFPCRWFLRTLGCIAAD